MRILFIAILCLACAGLRAATWVCANGTRTEVVNKIAGASPGDIVIVPADTQSWSPNITISGITLQGPGKNAPSPMNVTGGEVIINKHSSQYTKLIGFRFTNSSVTRHVTASGARSLKAYICESNFWNVDQGHCLVFGSGGLVAVCDISRPAPAGVEMGWCKDDNETTSWSGTQTLGILDTTGENNLYLEDCTVTNVTESFVDVDVGGRAVIRHSTWVDSSIIVHGGGTSDGGNDSSLTGHKHTEIYKNRMIRALNSANLNQWIHFRGGSGVIISNDMDKAESPDGSSYAAKNEVKLTVGCPSGGSYPRPYQIGQTLYPPVDTTPDYPVLIFGNTGPGSTDVDNLPFTKKFLSVGDGPKGCSNPSFYVQEDRDYFLNNAWGWVPYTYPHPLRSEGGGTPPAPPPGSGLPARIGPGKSKPK